MAKRRSKLDEALKEFLDAIAAFEPIWSEFKAFGPETPKNREARNAAYEAGVEPGWRLEFARRKVVDAVGRRKLPAVYALRQGLGLLVTGGRATVCRISELDV
jgi:hypothetical protein